MAWKIIAQILSCLQKNFFPVQQKRPETFAQRNKNGDDHLAIFDGNCFLVC